MKASLTVLSALCFATGLRAADFQNGQAADVVLGQPDFVTGDMATPVQANRFHFCHSVAMDPITGKVFVSDEGNNRVLRFSSAAAAQTGSTPEAVFGQPDFTSNLANQGGAVSATTLNGCTGVFVDSLGRLWVVDSGNSRVLGFFSAASRSNDPAANVVLGQPNFTATGPSISASRFNFPDRAVVDNNDTLWVSDESNNRVLRFDGVTGKASGASADGVLGQVDFDSNGPGLSATTMKFPAGLAVDGSGHLWVSEVGNWRVLRFDMAAAKPNGAAADGVLGQPDFTTANTTLFNPPGAKIIGQCLGLMVDPAGALWVADTLVDRVVRFSNAAALPNFASADLVLGQAGLDGLKSGTTSSLMKGPVAICAGPNGSIFVVDDLNSRVLRFSPIAAPTPGPHPSDTNADFTIGISEGTTYRAAFLNGGTWPTGPSPITASYAARARFLFLQGGGYLDNATDAPPLNWIPNN